MSRFTYVILVLTSHFIFAQTPDTLDVNNFKGRQAMRFEFDRIDIENFNGGIGLKKWHAGGMVYCGTFKCAVNFHDREKSMQLLGEKSTEVLIGVEFSTEKHVRLVENISPYSGITVGVGYERIMKKTEADGQMEFFLYPYHYNNETKSSLGSAAFYVDFGVEFFIHRNISLSGQYSIGGLYKFGEERIVSNTVKGTRRISKIETGIFAGSLILSIYY